MMDHQWPVWQQGGRRTADRVSLCPLPPRLRRQRAPSLTGARSPRLCRRRGHRLTCPLPSGRGNSQPSVLSPTEQAQDKVVLSVEPGAAEGQTSVSPQGADILGGVLVRIFRMNGLASGKSNGLRRFGESGVLRPATTQVHLDASVLLVVEGEMGKGRYMKIG